MVYKISLVSKTNLGSSFQFAQFMINGYSIVLKLDKNKNKGDLLLYLLENITYKILCEYTSKKLIENVYIEIKVRTGPNHVHTFQIQIVADPMDCICRGLKL